MRFGAKARFKRRYWRTLQGVGSHQGCAAVWSGPVDLMAQQVVEMRPVWTHSRRRFKKGGGRDGLEHRLWKSGAFSLSYLSAPFRSFLVLPQGKATPIARKKAVHPTCGRWAPCGWRNRQAGSGHFISAKRKKLTDRKTELSPRPILAASGSDRSLQHRSGTGMFLWLGLTE